MQVRSHKGQKDFLTMPDFFFGDSFESNQLLKNFDCMIAIFTSNYIDPSIVKCAFS